MNYDFVNKLGGSILSDLINVFFPRTCDQTVNIVNNSYLIQRDHAANQMSLFKTPLWLFGLCAMSFQKGDLEACWEAIWLFKYSWQIRVINFAKKTVYLINFLKPHIMLACWYRWVFQKFKCLFDGCGKAIKK